MSIARHHSEWIRLIETSGPFLSIPVLSAVFNSGLDSREVEKAKRLRMAYAEWREKPDDLSVHAAWIRHVLSVILEYPDALLKQGQDIPAGCEACVAEHGETLRPDMVLVAPDDASKIHLLIATYKPGQKLDSPLAGSRWKASPATRMTELLHAMDLPLGLVTNGEQWMIVYAPRGETSGYATWYAALWQEEHITLRAFTSLLRLSRFFSVAAEDTLVSMYARSTSDQQDVTSQLGLQVRQAVEVLVQSFDRIDRDAGGKLLGGMEPVHLYESALTVMMRLVFLFAAEERGMLLLGDPMYDENYAVSTLRDQLREAADLHGEEVLERRYDAWTRLLATFRAVHGGVSHDYMQLPPYGGSLFDPDRFPFLEGRKAGSSWRETPARPLPVNNRVVLHLLESLQILQVRIAGGGKAEARRLSFRELDIEQIGHVYEGLLDHTAVRADKVVLGLKGTRDKEPMIALEELEKLNEQPDKLVEFLKDETGRSAGALRNALKKDVEIDERALLVACGNDDDLFKRVRLFAALLSEDTYGLPEVVHPGSLYVTEGTARRSSGTHYTPRSLTEPIVQYTLEPLVYVGPAEGHPKEEWKLKSPKELLELKVCDMAMGSGAFLVQACRYLSERLVESWENILGEDSDTFYITPDGTPSKGKPSERLIPRDVEERLAVARRLVADRCLYGVDINPMAVEMAKLSLWLITLQKDRPFTFVDHALKCGDSLVGIQSLEQLEKFSLRPRESDLNLAAGDLSLVLSGAIAKRKELEAMPSESFEQISSKSRLYRDSEDAVARLKYAADVLISLEMYHRGREFESKRTLAAANCKKMMGASIDEFRNYAKSELQGRRTFHWPLEFPEVFERTGFDAFVGNPPFMGGQKITGNLGTDYRDYIIAVIANNKVGSADFCAYFFLRSCGLLKSNGMFGMLATNTIAQGDTREVGLDQIVSKGFSIPRAVPSRQWPGAAALEVAHVWLHKGEWLNEHFLNENKVVGINSFLDVIGTVTGKPYSLIANENKSFQGSIVLGMGFVLSPDQANELIMLNIKNKDVLYPYLTGDDLNSRLDQSPSRWVINFHDWPLDRSAKGKWLSASDKQKKQFLREGIVPFDYPGQVAADYPEILKIIERDVKPTRIKNEDRGASQFWWRYLRPRPELYSSINGMKFVLSRSRVSNINSIAFVPTNIILSDALVVFVLSDYCHFAILQSIFHTEWLIHYSSSMRNDVRYTPSDCFETFPFPSNLHNLEEIGQRYYQYRQTIMIQQQEGLTNTYNRFHDPHESSLDIDELRHLQVEMDKAVISAYEWYSVDLSHGFHETRQGIRFTISEPARREVLDRLLALNHQRYDEEVKAGLHDKKGKKTAGKKQSGKGALVDDEGNEQGEMF